MNGRCDSRFAGRVAVLTGAAGGIGREIAALFDQKGVRLSLADLDVEGMERLGARLSIPPLITRCDVTDRDAVAGLAARTVAELGGIDIVVNNAGVIRPERFEDASYENIDLQLGVNLMGAINVTRETIPALKERGGGHIVMLASLAGLVPEPRSSIYSVTKFGLRSLGLTLGLELAEHNIKVSNICPNSVATPMLEYEATHGGSPLGFVGEPSPPRAVAEAVWTAITRNKCEVYVPGSDGHLSKLLMLFPWMVHRLWPRLERMGRKRMEKKGLNPG